MNLLIIYAFIFIIVWIILGITLKFKKVSYLKSIGITVVVIILGFLLGVIPTHVGKSGDSAFYTYNIYKTVRIYGKGDAYVDVPEGVKKIIVHNGIEVFGTCSGYKKLQCIKMADSVTEIGGVSNCTSLKEVKMSNNLKIINDGTFDGCENLENIVIPETVEKIGSSVFAGTNISEITMPNNAIINKSTIDSFYDAHTFKGCNNLKKVNVEIENEHYINIDGVIFNKDETEIVCYPANCEYESYIIPNSVQYIYGGTFEWCNNLKKLTISGSIETIENNSIWCCNNLETIEINERS